MQFVLRFLCKFTGNLILLANLYVPKHTHAHAFYSRFLTRELLAMAFSCESKRSSVYHKDLRWRMVWQRIALNKTFTEIAANLCVDQATVKRVIDLFENTGDVRKRPYPKQPFSPKGANKQCACVRNHTTQYVRICKKY